MRYGTVRSTSTAQGVYYYRGLNYTACISHSFVHDGTRTVPRRSTNGLMDSDYSLYYGCNGNAMRMDPSREDADGVSLNSAPA
eukprot:SAG31_NODE_641_length_13313_cov_5.365219_4_plen_83_part_00